MNKEALKKQCPFVFSEMFEWNVYQLAKEEIQNQTIIDVGAHYGFFAIQCASLGAHQIICLEPNPNNYMQLLSNTSSIPCIKTASYAVTEKAGPVRISDAGELSQVGDKGFNVFGISLKNALSIIPNNQDLLLKIDVEGHEHKIIKNLDFPLRNHFKILYVEIHGEQVSGEGNTIKSLENYIISQGYAVGWRGEFFTESVNKERVPNTNVAVYKFLRI